MGSHGAYTPHPTQKFQVYGSMDGSGIEKIGAYWYVYLNHEYATRHEITLPSGEIFYGAPLSLYVFTEDWKIVGGKFLVSEKYSATTGSALVNHPFGGLCSATLVTNGFHGGSVFLTSEEGEGGYNSWAVYVETGKAYRLEGVGALHHENTVAASSYLPLNKHASQKTVLLTTDDSSDGSGEVYMYVGSQTAADPNGFADGTLYVLHVVGYDFETFTLNTVFTAEWVPIPRNISTSLDFQVLDTWGNTNQRSTNFRKIEDICEDPNNRETFYFAATGGNFATNSSLTLTTFQCAQGVAGVDGGCDNPFGKLYKLTISRVDPTLPPTLELVLEGGPTTGGGFDNVLVTRGGDIYIVEDPTPPSLNEIFKVQGRYAQVRKFNPTTKQIVPFMEMDYETINPSAPNYTEHMSHSGLIEFGSASNPVFLMAFQGPVFAAPPMNAGLLNIFAGQLALFVPLDAASVAPVNQPKDYGPIGTYQSTTSTTDTQGLVAALAVGWVVAFLLFVALVAFALMVFLGVVGPKPVQEVS